MAQTRYITTPNTDCKIEAYDNNGKSIIVIEDTFYNVATAISVAMRIAERNNRPLARIVVTNTDRSRPTTSHPANV